MEYHSEVRHLSRPSNEITENSEASCSRPRTKLRDFLQSDNPALSYADFHQEITQIEASGISKSSGRQQNLGAQGRARYDGTSVKHIPRENKGKEIQEKLSTTVSSNDWRQFDKLYKHSPTPYKNSGISPTSSSSYFSTDGSSSTSSRGNSSSPGHQRSQPSPSQPRLETSLVKNYIRDECFSARRKSPARQITYHLVPQSKHPKQFPPQAHITKQQKLSVVDQTAREAKMRIQESKIVPSQYSRNSHSSASNLLLPEVKGLKSPLKKDNFMHSHVPYSCPLPCTENEIGNRKTGSCQISGRPSGTPSRSRNTVRQPSPIRRLSSAVGSFIRSAGSRENSPLRRSNPKDSVEQDKSCTEKPQANSRARSSPIRRLLDPLLKSKPPNAREVVHISKPDYSTSLQALLQVSVKNGLPLFTFAVDNDSDILAATPKKSNAPERIWIYTFFTIHEMKKKNGLWLNNGTKGNSYVPNVLAQMKVSNPQFPDVNLREFSLFSVDTRQIDQNSTEFQPTTELAAIVAKLPSNSKSMNSSEMSSTVILPGDIHTIPIKGPVSTLTQRWRSGGSCDCGGWDVGCQLRIFNQLNSVKTAISSDEFKLFSQVGQETQAVLSLKPYKDRIYSVEFESSFSLLQAFATAVAVLDCTRFVSDSYVVEGRASTSVSNFDDPFLMKLDNESHVSYPPPHSPVGRV